MTAVHCANSQNDLLAVCFDFLVYQRGGNGCGKAVVDINGGNARSAAIEHCQQRRESLEAGAVADAGRHGDYRTTEQTSHDAGQRSFHPGHHDDDVGALKLRQMLEQSVQPGYPDIAYQFGALAHNLGRDLCLGRNGQVGRAGGDDGQDGLGGRQLLLLEDDCPGQLLIPGAGELAGFYKCIENLGCGPGRQNVVSFGRKALEYLYYVFGGLAGAEDNLGETTSNLTMMVDARKAQIFERQMPKLLDRLVDIDLVVLDLL